MFGFLSGSSSSSSSASSPKRASTLLKAPPLPSKLTMATSPTDYASPSFSSSPSSYPPPESKSSVSSNEAQWEHVQNGTQSSDTDSDTTTFERLSIGHADADRSTRGGTTQPSSPPARTSAKWHEERERMRQQLDMALAAQRKAESERDRWERRAMDLRGVRPDRERDKDTFKAENERLKKTLEHRVQQLEAMREEMKQERVQHQSETERLEGALNTARRAPAEELETLKTTLQKHVNQVEFLTGERDRVLKERESIMANHSGEIERLRVTYAKEIEQAKKAVEEVNQDRLQAHSELRKARVSLDVLGSKLDESRREADALHRALFDTKESSRRASELKQQLDAQYKALQNAREESSALKKEFLQLTTLLEDRTLELKESSRRVSELKQQLDAQYKALQNAREESSALKREFLQLTTLLEDRTSELKGAQSFLTTADAFSGVEVTNTLRRLNAEMLQSTAYMAESMVELFFHDTTSQATKTDEQLTACKRAYPAIGAAIVHFLGTKKHRDDPILIQIAFQAYMTYRLRWIACSWIICGDEDHNRFIEAIYQSVRDSEAQAIAGRWRALTRGNVPSTPFDESQLAFQISTKMISGLSDILLTTGCNAPKADIVAAITSKFAEKLSLLVSLAMRVNKIVGEVTSGDFEVLAVPPGTAFDVTTMEDSYDDGSAKGKGNTHKVLCATDLGLRKKTRIATTGENQWETKVLLKPKVALESVIDILDD